MTTSTAGSVSTSTRGEGSSAGSSASRTTTSISSPFPLALDGDLDDAQQRAVAPLAHELGVDAEPAVGARPVRESLEIHH
jgi:hypothetical protein